MQDAAKKCLSIKTSVSQYFGMKFSMITPSTYAFYEILLIYIQMVRLKYTKICASCQPAVHKLTFVHSVHLVHRGADLDD